MADLRITSLSDLYKRAKLELEEVKSWQETPQGLSKEQVIRIKQQMQNRKEQIERICDAHLRELLRITRQEPTRFNNMDYKKKFLVLAANEQMLIRSYRRQNKLSLRMKGITQSYYQYDSELYK